MSEYNIILRPATPDNLADLQRLSLALFQYEDEHGFYDHTRSLEWTYGAAGTKYFTERCAGGPDGTAFVAEADGQVIGYLAAGIYSRTWMAVNPIAEIENMFVDSAHRHHGVGAQLVQAFKTWAHEHGAQRLKVGASSDNHPALKFYHSQGFQNSEIYLEQAGDRPA